MVPLVAPRCLIVVYNWTQEHGTWQGHSVHRFFIGLEKIIILLTICILKQQEGKEE